jgi:hypothetical protein
MKIKPKEPKVTTHEDGTSSVCITELLAYQEALEPQQYFCVFYDPHDKPVELFGPELFRDKRRAEKSLTNVSDPEEVRNYSIRKVILTQVCQEGNS